MAMTTSAEISARKSNTLMRDWPRSYGFADNAFRLVIDALETHIAVVSNDLSNRLSRSLQAVK